MDMKTAGKVEEILRRVNADLNESIRIVQESSGTEEFARYRSLVGKLMGELFLDVIQPLYDQFPDLRPGDLRPPNDVE